MTMIIRKISPLGALSIKPKTGKTPHPNISVIPSIFNLKLIFIIAWAFMTFGLSILSQPVQGAPSVAETPTLSPSGPLNYDEAVRIALHQSPFFLKSSLEIEVKRMDETDSRYGLFPAMDFRTYYYVNRPSGMGGVPYSLNFSTDPGYNPVASYFILQAQKLATQAAILTHLKAISAGLERLGQLFLSLDLLRNRELNTKDQLNLFREKLAYAENRLSAGTGTSLEVKEAQQGLKSAQSELENLAFEQKRGVANLKNFLGLKSTQELTPDLQNIHGQVVGSFDPNSVTWEQAKTRSYDLQILEIVIKLQTYNVSLAKAKSLPTLLFTTQTPDPLSTSRYGLYAGFGLYVPVWDGFKRIRNVSRQKTILKQHDTDKTQVEKELESKFLEAQGKVMDTASSLNLAKSQLEIFQIKARQQETSYQSGAIPLSQLLDSYRDVFAAKNLMFIKAMAHDKETLGLRMISGDLGYTYVRSSSWQQ
jgi:outer membrane protein TolC